MRLFAKNKEIENSLEEQPEPDEVGILIHFTPGATYVYTCLNEFFYPMESGLSYNGTFEGACSDR